MKKKKVEEDNLTKMINEIEGILDREYFHMNIKITEEQKIEWVVYYRNLNTKIYFSNKNKPLLTSSKNTIADIYTLRDIFQELQDQIIEEEGYAFFKDKFNIYYLILEIKERATLGMLDIFTTYVLVNLVTNLITNNLVVSFINLIACIGIAIFIYYKSKKLNKLIDNAEKIENKILLKNLIKGKGLGFVKEIRRELHNKGVYKYGINKKTGKAIK